MKTILTFLAIFAFACLCGAVMSSCSVMDERAWADQSMSFQEASQVRHQAHAQRMMGVRE